MSDIIEDTPRNTDVPRERGGVYNVPVVGSRLSDVRDFYDELKPTPDDSVGVTFGKNAIRFGTVAATGVAATAAAAIVCL